MALKRTSKKQTQQQGRTNAKKSSQSGEAQVYKLIFQQTEFKTEAAVKSWLKKNQWTDDYKIENEDGEFIVKSKTAKAEDQFDLREVKLVDDGSISALVSRTSLGSSSLTAKSAAGEEGDPEDENDNTDEGSEGDDSDGEDGGDGEADGDEGDGDEGEGDGEGDGSDDTNNDDDDGDGDGDDAEDNGDDDNDGEDDDDDGEDPEGYASNRVGTDEDGNGGHRSIREKEKSEPKPSALPGQGTTPTGKGKPGHEPGDAGKNRIRRRKAAGRNPLGAVNGLIKKFDGYSVYLSGGMTLKEVLDDGLSDGIPPGVSEVFQSLYKAVGNTLKTAKGADLGGQVEAIAGEFSEAIVAIHGVWKELLKSGTPAQKKAAKKYFADVETANNGLQTSATPAKKAAPKSEEDRIAAAVQKAMAPLSEQLTKANERIAKLTKGAPSRNSLGNDDLDRTTDTEELRRKKEEQDDEEFINSRSRKALFGMRGNLDRD